MTPVEWRSTDDVLALLNAVADTVSDRRLRLLMLEYCRHVSPPPEVETFPEAIQLLVRQIHGRVRRGARQSLLPRIHYEWCNSANQQWCEVARLLASETVEFRTPWEVLSSLLQASTTEHLPPIALRESRKHAQLLREIIRPPGAIPFADAWLTETVRLLSDSIHPDRAFDRLPILADALEEAGCDNAELLTHCRGPGPHVFGCWALDLVRGCY